MDQSKKPPTPARGVKRPFTSVEEQKVSVERTTSTVETENVIPNLGPMVDLRTAVARGAVTLLKQNQSQVVQPLQAANCQTRPKVIILKKPLPSYSSTPMPLPKPSLAKSTTGQVPTADPKLPERHLPPMPSLVIRPNAALTARPVTTASSSAPPAETKLGLSSTADPGPMLPERHLPPMPSLVIRPNAVLTTRPLTMASTSLLSAETKLRQLPSADPRTMPPERQLPAMPSLVIRPNAVSTARSLTMASTSLLSGETKLRQLPSADPRTMLPKRQLPPMPSLVIRPNAVLTTRPLTMASTSLLSAETKLRQLPSADPRTMLPERQLPAMPSLVIRPNAVSTARPLTTASRKVPANSMSLLKPIHARQNAQVTTSVGKCQIVSTSTVTERFHTRLELNRPMLPESSTFSMLTSTVTDRVTYKIVPLTAPVVIPSGILPVQPTLPQPLPSLPLALNSYLFEEPMLNTDDWEENEPRPMPSQEKKDGSRKIDVMLSSGAIADAIEDICRAATTNQLRLEALDRIVDLL